MNVNRYVGREIRRRRHAQGLTLARMAMEVGLTGQQLHKYEAGKNRVTSGRLHNIAKVLGCRVADLFPPLEGGARETERAALLARVKGLAPEQQRAVCKLARELARA